MAFVHAVCITTYGSRSVKRSVGGTERTDTFARCMLQADAGSVDELPTMGEMIEGLDDGIIVDTGSTVLVLDGGKEYTMGQDLIWHETGGAG